MTELLEAFLPPRISMSAIPLNKGKRIRDKRKRIMETKCIWFCFLMFDAFHVFSFVSIQFQNCIVGCSRIKTLKLQKFIKFNFTEKYIWGIYFNNHTSNHDIRYHFLLVSTLLTIVWLRGNFITNYKFLNSACQVLP